MRTIFFLTLLASTNTSAEENHPFEHFVGAYGIVHSNCSRDGDSTIELCRVRLVVVRALGKFYQVTEHHFSGKKKYRLFEKRVIHEKGKEVAEFSGGETDTSYEADWEYVKTRFSSSKAEAVYLDVSFWEDKKSSVIWYKNFWRKQTMKSGGHEKDTELSRYFQLRRL